MTAIITTFLFCWLTLTVAPRTAIGSWLRHWLVLIPAARLSAVSRADAVIGLTVLVASVVMVSCDDGLAARLFVTAVPDVALWVSAVEWSMVLDTIVAVAAAVAAWRGRGDFARTSLPLRRAGRFRRRRTVAPRRSSPANDDEGPDHAARTCQAGSPALRIDLRSDDQSAASRACCSARVGTPNAVRSVSGTRLGSYGSIDSPVAPARVSRTYCVP